ncbi:MAG: VacB/RNase II family 3'-5' exoribonuclease [Pseudomonadota bacterium]
MLDRNSIAQLRGLKNQMEAEKERAEAVLRGTTARYGFARLDDGREVFVPPNEMLKGFPGDRVRVCVKPGKDKRPVAEIEGLVSGCLEEFTGRCVSKGKALFVQPDHETIQRWLFLPPSERAKAKPGDYLRCRLHRHPIKDGKPQARVLENLGNAADPGIENRYTIAKHGLPTTWPENLRQQVRSALDSGVGRLADREDFTNLDFVTIDAARTLDIDDALYAEVTTDGWLLYVAIADPTAYVEPNSPLFEAIKERASSVYFHGTVVPMLPEELSQQCALAEDELRPAVVCRISIAESGDVGDFEFFEALIRSRAKLAYYLVDRYLTGEDDALMCHSSPLEALFQVSRALRKHREDHELVMEERREFRWILDEQGHIDTIEPCEKLLSQRLVEECMIVANRCAAMLLATSGAPGPFVIHDGFRKDRGQDRDRFVKEFAPKMAEVDLDSVEGYRDLMHALSSADHEMPLRSMVNRLLTRARLSTKAKPHKGLALGIYSNCTSPLRKCLDLVTQLHIKSVIRGERAALFSQGDLEKLTQRLQKLRQISLEAERWLTLLHLQHLSKGSNGAWPGRISHISNHGFTVQLDHNGLEGYVDLRHEKDRFQFDRLRSILKSKARTFHLDMPVEVTLAGEDGQTPHLPLFKLARSDVAYSESHDSKKVIDNERESSPAVLQKVSEAHSAAAHKSPIDETRDETRDDATDDAIDEKVADEKPEQVPIPEADTAKNAEAADEHVSAQ